jgi:hypothetical protein
MKLLAESAIKHAVEQVNVIESHEPKFQASPESQIFGGANGLDSLNFAFFVITIEQFLRENGGYEIVLFDDYIFNLDSADPNHPFATISSLINYIESKLLSV